MEAKGYLFINCIWVYPTDYKNKGYGSGLIKECLKDAKGTKGAAVVAGDTAFMAAEDIFLRNGFRVVEEDGKRQLLVKQLKKGSLPAIKDYQKQLRKLKGWHIIYSNQCPWVSRFIDELDKKTKNKLKLKITELKTPKQAQNAPSLYATFNLIHDGKLLVDHYVSQKRFESIIRKETTAK